MLAESCSLVCFHILAERGELEGKRKRWSETVWVEMLRKPSRIDRYRCDPCPLRVAAGRIQNALLCFAVVFVCRRGLVVLGAGLALLRTIAREAPVLILATAHTGTGQLSQLHEHRCSK